MSKTAKKPSRHLPKPVDWRVFNQWFREHWIGVIKPGKFPKSAGNEKRGKGKP
jgi:hypothetical protein